MTIMSDRVFRSRTQRAKNTPNRGVGSCVARAFYESSPDYQKTVGVVDGSRTRELALS